MSKHAINKIKIFSLIQQLLGLAISIFFGVPAIVATFQKEFGLACITSAFTIIGISLLISGIKKKKVLRLYKTYRSHFATDPTMSIDLLSSSTATSIEMVTQNLSAMINYGLFPNSYIDINRHCLVYGKEPLNNNKTAKYDRPSSRNASFSKTVECPNCGATNSISIEQQQCEYCGSPLKI